MRVVLFTDTLGDVNGVSRFIRNAAAQAAAGGRSLTVLTSTRFEIPAQPNLINVPPRLATRMPKYENLEIVLPPWRRMMAAARELAPDVVHVSTPGPVGTVGRIFARRRGLPLLGVYHTDFPAYADRLLDDPALTWTMTEVMRRFYRPFARIFTRSADYARRLKEMGIPCGRLKALRPGIDVQMFHPRHAAPGLWAGHAGAEAGSVKVLYAGRVSVEKNMPLLLRIWPRVRRACAAAGAPAQLVLVGDGPYRRTMEAELARESPGSVLFLGFRYGAELSAIYASSDLFLFPSLTDTLGQVVMEAQASGLPVVVSDEGGPKEVTRDGRTGIVVPAADEAAWVRAVTGLVVDASRRRAMGEAARREMDGMTFAASFEHFWSVHEEVLAEARAGLLPRGCPPRESRGERIRRAAAVERTDAAGAGRR